MYFFLQICCGPKSALWKGQMQRASACTTPLEVYPSGKVVDLPLVQSPTTCSIVDYNPQMKFIFLIVYEVTINVRRSHRYRYSNIYISISMGAL